MDDPLFSPAFFWIWNAPLRVGELCAQLEDMSAHGLRNVCIHPFPKGFRPGTCPSEISPDYLTPEFLDVFAAHLGTDLGTTVRVAFTDEPDMPHDIPGQSLAWASDFDAEFRRRKGYDIVPHVPALLADPEGTDPALSRFRVDVQDVKADLFVERFLAPLRDWCRAHGILSGGHLNNEDQPEFEAQLGHGNLLRSLRAMDVPGVDVI